MDMNIWGLLAVLLGVFLCYGAVIIGAIRQH